VNQVRTLLGTGLAGYSERGEIQIAEPFGVIVGPDEGLYFCDLGNHRIRRWHDGKVTTVVGTGQQGSGTDGGPATSSAIDEPYEIRFDGSANLFFVDMKNHVVRRVDAKSGMIDTVAGNGEAGFTGDGGLASDAQLNQPHSIEFDQQGRLYIADIGNHRIRRVDPLTGVINTFAGTGETGTTIDGAAIATADLYGPRAIAFAGNGDMYLALREANRIFRIDMVTGIIHHVAGTGKFGYEGDGADARTAKLAGPKGISLSAAGDIYLADTESHVIRKIDIKTRVIETVLGDATRHDGPDGDPLQCGLARPHGIFVDSGNNLIVGDSDNHRVRQLPL
jgi:streptogramin lyase